MGGVGEQQSRRRHEASARYQLIATTFALVLARGYGRSSLPLTQKVRSRTLGRLGHQRRRGKLVHPGARSVGRCMLGRSWCDGTLQHPLAQTAEPTVKGAVMWSYPAYLTNRRTQALRAVSIVCVRGAGLLNHRYRVEPPRRNPLRKRSNTGLAVRATRQGNVYGFV